MNFDEAGVISAVAEVFGRVHPGVEIGIGDDAAVVSTTAHTVITTDIAVEGTHFSTKWSSAFEIGRKITAANLADVYAMGGLPTYLVVALTLTGQESIEWIQELAEGISHEASSCGAYIVGGDLAKGPCKMISIAAMGRVDKPLTRSGATVGDEIYISSLPGWSAAGLALIEIESDDDLVIHAQSEYCAPTVDYASAVQFLNANASSMCDISDALIIQGQQISEASGVGLRIDQDLISQHPEFASLREIAEAHNCDVWQWILAGGEDHVFLATGRDMGGFCIGKVFEGHGIIGVEMKKAPETWRHFQ